MAVVGVGEVSSWRGWQLADLAWLSVFVVGSCREVGSWSGWNSWQLAEMSWLAVGGDVVVVDGIVCKLAVGIVNVVGN